MDIEYARPDTARPVVFSRERAVAELVELKDHNGISHIQIWNDVKAGEYQGRVFVAVTPNDTLYDDWFTFSSKAFEHYATAVTFIKEAGCQHLLEDSAEYKK